MPVEITVHGNNKNVLEQVCKDAPLDISAAPEGSTFNGIQAAYKAAAVVQTYFGNDLNMIERLAAIAGAGAFHCVYALNASAEFYAEQDWRQAMHDIGYTMAYEVMPAATPEATKAIGETDMTYLFPADPLGAGKFNLGALPTVVELLLMTPETGDLTAQDPLAEVLPDADFLIFGYGISFINTTQTHMVGLFVERHAGGNIKIDAYTEGGPVLLGEWPENTSITRARLIFNGTTGQCSIYLMASGGWDLAGTVPFVADDYYPGVTINPKTLDGFAHDAGGLNIGLKLITNSADMDEGLSLAGLRDICGNALE
jgi:hypothetical protein